MHPFGRRAQLLRWMMMIVGQRCPASCSQARAPATSQRPAASGPHAYIFIAAGGPPSLVGMASRTAFPSQLLWGLIRPRSRLRAAGAAAARTGRRPAWLPHRPCAGKTARRRAGRPSPPRRGRASPRPTTSCAPIGAPCTQCLRHGDPMRAQERLTDCSSVAIPRTSSCGASSSASTLPGRFHPHPCVPRTGTTCR
jgi:hypothetical protein